MSGFGSVRRYRGGNSDSFIFCLSQQVEDYRTYIQSFPGIDGPEVFGLHPNADLTFRNKEALQLLSTLMETQPKQAPGRTGRTREDMVSISHYRFLDMLLKLPTTLYWVYLYHSVILLA